MKIQTLYISYIDLTPGLENKYAEIAHKSIINTLRLSFFSWNSFFSNYGKEYSIGFFVTTKKGTSNLITYGPTLSKRKIIVDYSIFLPDEIRGIEHYIDLVFEGFKVILTKYEVPEDEILRMKNECKRELDL